MAMQLTAAFAQLSVGKRVAPQPFAAAPTAKFGFCTSLRGTALTVSRRPSTVPQAAVFEVVAKQNALKRQRVAEKARQYNKSRKSAMRTRMKKVFVALDGLKGALSSEEQLAPVEKLISEAYQEIDKAVGKGVLHQNTGARRKARLAAAKRNALIEAGLYTPA